MEVVASGQEAVYCFVYRTVGEMRKFTSKVRRQIDYLLAGQGGGEEVFAEGSFREGQRWGAANAVSNGRPRAAPLGADEA